MRRARLDIGSTRDPLYQERVYRPNFSEGWTGLFPCQRSCPVPCPIAVLDGHKLFCTIDLRRDNFAIAKIVPPRQSKSQFESRPGSPLANRAREQGHRTPVESESVR